MTVQHRFKPEQFVLDPSTEQFQLDQGVAATIANVLYAGDPETHDGNNWGEPLIIVDPSGQTTTHGVPDLSEAGTEDTQGYRISLEAGGAADVNELFAREIRAAFLDNERRHRMGWKGSLGAMLVAGTILEGGPLATALFTDLSAIGKSELIAFGSYITLLQLRRTRRNLHRLNIIRPGSRLNVRHLESAGKNVATLDLPPVLAAA